jgi:hypothetical protein
MRLCVAAVLVLAAVVAFGSEPDPCSLTSTVPDAAVSVAIPDGRKSFKEGEIIPLVLSFTSTANDRYIADVRGYDRSGRLTIETYCVEPAVRDPLADYFSTGAFMGGLGSTQHLSQKPFTATAQLNEWRQPGPGHYRLYVVSHRVWRPPDSGEQTPYQRVSVTLRSNPIEFDVVAADADWSSQQLQQATAAFQADTGGKEVEAAKKLRFLNTRESTDTLARLFIGLNDQQSGGWDLMFGLYGSSYRTEAIAAMQREINDPTHPITQEFLQTLGRMQIGADPKWAVPVFDPEHRDVWEDYWRRRQAHEHELAQTLVAATVSALPQKTGRARVLTVQTLAQSSDLLNPATAAQMRKQLIASWRELPEHTQQELIQYRWQLIGGPEMLPILLDLVSGPAPLARTMDAMARDAALRRIYELDPAKGRSLILRDLSDPKAQPSVSLVKLLPADQLQPVVQESLRRIEQNNARDLDYHLLELYGSQSDSKAVETVFNQHLGEWACDPQDAMLRYFLRVDPEFGIRTVQASLAARQATGCYHMLLQDLGKSLPKVESIAIKALDDPDLELANDAALALGSWGTAKAEAALWARLESFHQDWKGREGELRQTDNYNSPTDRATAFEATLINSIATGTSWICDPRKLDRLSALASPRQQLQVSNFRRLWGQDERLIQPNWFPEGTLSFGVLQYSNLDEEQFRLKLSQFPRGTKFKFQLWKPGQISPPVSIERQEAVLQSLRTYAAKFGMSIEGKSDQ